MGKFLKILGVVCLVVIGLAVAGMFWAHSSGAKAQEKFFEAMGSGDVAKVMALMEPSLKTDLDEPVLAAYMKGFNADLGAFKGLSKSNFNTSSSTDGGVTTMETTGTVLFEKGEATSELVYQNDLLVKFKVESETLSDDWFPADLDTTIYREKGKAFLEALLGGKVADAYAMTHKEFQEKIPLGQLEADMKATLADVGALKSVAYESETMKLAKSPKLEMYYRMETGGGKTITLVKFQFVGLKGHLVMFTLAAKEAD